MAYEVVMPQLGLSMDSGQIVQWLKQTGDPVKAGDLLLVVESDKSTIEVEAVESGILHILAGPEDGQIPVGEVIANLLAEGEPVPGERPARPQQERPAVLTALDGASEGDGTPRAAPQLRQEGLRRPPSTPAARRIARQAGLDWRLATPTGLRGQIKARDVLVLAKAVPPPTPETISITPVARRLAQAAGLDLAELAHEFPGKKLERADVEAAIRRAIQASPARPAASPAPAPPPAAAQRQAASSLRRLIAERMAHSAHTTAPVTLVTKANASELVRLRAALKADPQSQVGPSYNVLLAALVARALAEHPLLNASFDGDEILYHPDAHIGIAVDTGRGLVVPVLRSAGKKTLRALAVEAEDLLARAAQGQALPDELTGSTFTITNLGAYEIDAFTPIVNLPECAVLGIGRLVQEAVPVDGQVEIHTNLTLSLTFDHRLVDGAPAARFLQRIKQFVEEPYLWLS